MPLIESIQNVTDDCRPTKNIQIHSHGEMLDQVFRLPPNVCVLFTARPGEQSFAHPDDIMNGAQWAWQQSPAAAVALTGGGGNHIDPPWFLATGVNNDNWANDGPPGPLTRYPGTAEAQDIGVSQLTELEGPSLLSGPDYVNKKSLYKGGQLIQNMKYSMGQNWWGPPSYTTQQFGIYDPTSPAQYQSFKRSQEKWKNRIDLINWHDRVQFPELGQVIDVNPDSPTTATPTSIPTLDQHDPNGHDDGNARTVDLFSIIKKLLERYPDPATKILINASPCRVCRPASQDALVAAADVAVPVGRTGSLGQAGVGAIPSIIWPNEPVETVTAISAAKLQPPLPGEVGYRYFGGSVIKSKTRRRKSRRTKRHKSKKHKSKRRKSKKHRRKSRKSR